MLEIWVLFSFRNRKLTPIPRVEVRSPLHDIFRKLFSVQWRLQYDVVNAQWSVVSAVGGIVLVNTDECASQCNAYLNGDCWTGKRYVKRQS